MNRVGIRRVSSEDALLPNTDQINQTVFNPNATTATSITVDHGDYFRVGDLLRPGSSTEVMLVTAVAANVLTVVRSYGGSTAVALANDMVLHTLGNAALEGADAPAVRFTNRARRRNYTQIFTAAVEVSGTLQATPGLGIADELDFQKQERLRELLRDLENCVINGVAPIANPEGSSSVRRSMNGLVSLISTNEFQPGQNGLPLGGGSGDDELTEELLNASLRRIWEQSSGTVDTIVVGGAQKRRINSFASASRSFAAADTRYRDMIGVYESDFGVCKVILSRWVAPDSVLFLDSSRIEVLPLTGRSFQFKPLAPTGDSHRGLVLGEYTVEVRNENAHGRLSGLAS